MVKVFVEGGARGALNARCREGFTKFFEKAGLKGKMPRVVACGSRSDAYNDFCTALAQAKPSDVIVLLVDSEAPVTVEENQVWQHVLHREGDKWQQPVGAEQNHLHFMVECMEAWFMADKNCLAAYFGQGFEVSKLPNQSNIEKISKANLYAGLEKATKNCKTKACYGKGSHSFDILGKIDPQKVLSASSYAARLVDHLTSL
ncbi:MAG: hypothetical protein CTY16_01465 [Methylobacter sp.]|nr:MAG: hypothetical protein CTY16_01465 [Methylobacter sp.]